MALVVSFNWIALDLAVSFNWIVFDLALAMERRRFWWFMPSFLHAWPGRFAGNSLPLGKGSEGPKVHGFIVDERLAKPWRSPVGEADATDLKSTMLPEWSNRLANLYWIKRYCREPDQACRRKAWRKIAVEKKRLLSEGVVYIELHLVCRVLTNPRNQNAADRLKTYHAQLPLFP